MKYEPTALATASTVAAHGYRADIDGLRALAVMSVIVFHISKALLPGGFVGVDVFFVISGYLISAHIFQSARLGVFSFVDFYSRRIGRIVPAMTVVVLITLLAAEWLLLPDDARGAAKAALMAFASVANVHFWLNLDTGYFAASSNEVPLLHLWSLGVEEQFYMLWPLVAIGMCRWRSGAALVLMGLLALGSFAIGHHAYAHSPAFAYYMLPSRMGEMLVGAIAAHVALSNRITTLRRHGVLLAGAGFALVVASLVLLSERIVFPGWWALPPTVGAALIILGGGRHAGNPVSRLLARRPLRAIGKISYSAYLWHWPLLAFHRYGYGEPGLAAGLAILMLTLALAALTYRYVEQPVRAWKGLSERTVYGAWAASALLLVGVSGAFVYADRLVPSVGDTAYARALAAVRGLDLPTTSFDYVCQRPRLDAAELANPHCVIGKGGPAATRIVLMGDSNAAHYVGVLGAFAEQAGFGFRNFEVGSCPAVFADDDTFVPASRRAACRASHAVWKTALDEAQVVILGGSWTTYQAVSPAFLPALFDQVRRYAAQGKTVVLLGKVPEIKAYDRLCSQKALRFPFKHCEFGGNPPAADVAQVNAAMRQFAAATPNVRYFDLTAALCPDGMCSAYGPHHEHLYFDEAHLSMDGSWLVGRRIVQTAGVPEVFRF